TVVRLGVCGLLQRGLKQVSDMRAEIDRLMKLEDVLLFYRERLLIRWVVVFCLKIWNEAEDALRIVILFAGGIRGRSRFLLGGIRAGSGLLRSVGGNVGIGCDFWGGRFGARRGWRGVWNTRV